MVLTRRALSRFFNYPCRMPNILTFSPGPRSTALPDGHVHLNTARLHGQEGPAMPREPSGNPLLATHLPAVTIALALLPLYCIFLNLFARRKKRITKSEAALHKRISELEALLAQAQAQTQAATTPNATPGQAPTQSPDFYRLLVDNAGSPVYCASPGQGFRLVYVNGAACEHFGLPVEKLLSMSVHEWYPSFAPEDFDGFLTQMREKKRNVFQTHHRHASGLMIPVEVSATLLGHQGTEYVVGSIKDLAETKKAEEARQKSERILQAILQTEPGCVKLLDANHRVLSMNQAGLAMIEADAFQQVVGRSVLPLVMPAYREAFTALSRRIFGGEGGKLLFQIQGLRGTRRWLETSAVPIRDESGGIVSLLGISRDVTTQREGQQQLGQLQQQLEGIVQSAMDAIITVDKYHQVALFNAAAEALFGYSKDQIRGAPLGRLFPQLVRSGQGFLTGPSPEASRKQLAGGTVRTTFGRRRTGEVFPVEASTSAVGVGETAYYTLIVREVTEREQFLQKLEAEKQRFELALRGGNLGMWDWDIPTGKLIGNDRLREMTGYAEPEFAVHMQDWFALIHPEDLPLVTGTMQDHLEARREFYQAEYRIRHQSGKWKWVLACGQVLEWAENGQPLRAVGTLMDITARREAEQQNRYQAQLLELIDVGIISLRTDRVVRSWSKGAEAIFGVAAADALGKRLSHVLRIQPARKVGGLPVFEEARQAHAWKGEVIMSTASGKVHSVFLTFSRFSDVAGDEGYVLVCEHLNAIRGVQRQLLEKQAFIVSTVENSTEAIFTLNAAHELTYFNATAGRLYEQLVNTQLQMGLNVYAIASPEGQAQLVDNWAKAMQGEARQYDYPFRNGGGDELIFAVSVNPVYGVDGTVNGITYIARNVTEKRRQSRQLQQMQQQILEQKMKEQWVHATALLEGQELERKRLGRDLHDGLGQMLNVLKLHLSQEAASPRSLTMLDEIIGEVVQLNNNLMPLVLQDFGLEAGIRQLIAQYQRVSAGDIYFYSDLEARRFDPGFETGVYRVVQEAIGNAVKHARAGQVSVQLTHNQRTLLVMVEDDGQGFDPAAAGQGPRKSYGLLNMKFRVQSLGGTLLLDSRPGRGSTINVELPLAH